MSVNSLWDNHGIHTRTTQKQYNSNNKTDILRLEKPKGRAVYDFIAVMSKTKPFYSHGNVQISQANVELIFMQKLSKLESL